MRGLLPITVGAIQADNIYRTLPYRTVLLYSTAWCTANITPPVRPSVRPSFLFYSPCPRPVARREQTARYVRGRKKTNVDLEPNNRVRTKTIRRPQLRWHCCVPYIPYYSSAVAC